MSLASEPTRSLLASGKPALAGLRRHWMRFAAQMPIVPLAILIPFVLIAALAPAIAPYDPTEPIPGAGIFDPPFWV
jgi:ABC-type antimicrobial peptide transport system permease subunit